MKLDFPRPTLVLLSLCLTLFTAIGLAQDEKEASPDAATETKAKAVVDASLFAALKLRSIGPAFMSGRIGDLAIDQKNPNTWYVAVASGNVFKTSNAGQPFNQSLKTTARTLLVAFPSIPATATPYGLVPGKTMAGVILDSAMESTSAMTAESRLRMLGSRKANTLAKSLSILATQIPCSQPPRAHSGRQAGNVDFSKQPTVERTGKTF